MKNKTIKILISLIIFLSCCLTLNNISNAANSTIFKEDGDTLQNLTDNLNQYNNGFDINKNKENIKKFFEESGLKGKKIGTWLIECNDGHTGAKFCNALCWDTVAYDGNARYAKIEGVVDVKKEGIYLDGERKSTSSTDMLKALYVYFHEFKPSYGYLKSSPELRNWIRLKTKKFVYDKGGTISILNFQHDWGGNSDWDKEMNATNTKNNYEKYEYRMMVTSNSGAQPLIFMAAKEANEYGDLKITKSDANDSSKKLSGAEFKIKDSEGNLVKLASVNGQYKYSTTANNTIAKTNNNGVIEIKGLPVGTYKIVENKAPSGYNITSDRNVSITGNKTEQIVIEDSPKLGCLRIIKSDTSRPSIRLSGAKFKIKVKDGKWIQNSGISFENGNYKITSIKYTTNESNAAVFETTDGYISIFNVPVGTYTIKETQAPQNYPNVSTEIDLIVTEYKSGNEEKYNNYFINNGLYSLLCNKVDKNSEKISYKLIYYALTGNNYSGSDYQVRKADLKGKIKNIIIDQKNGQMDGYNLKNLFTNFGNDDKIKIREYIARVYGRLMQKDANYYTRDHAYVLTIYSRAIGYSCKGVTNKNLGCLDIIKTNSQNPNVKVKGAKYVLYDNTNKKYIKAEKSENKYNKTGYVNSESSATKFETDESGHIIVDLLEIGSKRYKLIEVQAPSGYSKASDVDNISVYSYARSGEFKKEYVIYALQTMLNNFDPKDDNGNRKLTPKQIQTIVSYALDGKNTSLTSTTITGIINEKISKDKVGLPTGESNSNNQQKVKKFMYDVYNRAVDQYNKYVNDQNKLSKKSKKTKDEQFGDDSYILVLYYRAVGHQAVTSSEPQHGNLRIVKYDKEDYYSLLKGAKFVIRKQDTEEYIKATWDSEKSSYIVNRKPNGEMDIQTNRATAKNNAFTTQNYGYLSIRDLDQGKYDIIEVEAPERYGWQDESNLIKIGNNVYGYKYKTITIQAKDKYSEIQNIRRKLNTILNSKNTDGTLYLTSNKEKYYALTGRRNGECSNIEDVIKSGFKETLSNGTTGMTYDDLKTANKTKMLEYIARVYSRTKFGNETHYNSGHATMHVSYIEMCGWTGIQIGNQPNNLLIKKVDKDYPDEILNKVGFTIKLVNPKNPNSSNKNKYVRYNGNTKIATYSDTPQEFITGTNGKAKDDGQIYIRRLEAGEYEIQETKLGNYSDYYDKKTFKVTVNPGDTGKTAIPLENEQKYVNLSGFVWQDVRKQLGKERISNNLYDKDNDNQFNDALINGIEVVLKDENGNVVKNGYKEDCTAFTKELTNPNNEKQNGYYRFHKVPKDNLANYYVEFTYDGLTYQSIIPGVTAENISALQRIEDEIAEKSDRKNNTFNFDSIYDISSKASETESRDNLNNAFATIDETNKVNYNNKDIQLNYEKTNKDGITNVNLKNGCKRDSTDKLVTIIDNKNGEFTTNSTTKQAGFDINNQYNKLKEKYKKPIYEITNINLGLEEREKTDISLVKDVENVKLSINGFNHIYNYGNKTSDYYKTLEERLEELKDVTEDNLKGMTEEEKSEYFNVGVSFKKDRYMDESNSYTQPIYKSDYEYEDKNDKNNELQTYITYKISMKNETTNLTTKVNSLVDYFDKKYLPGGLSDFENDKDKIVVGDGIDEETRNITNTSGIRLASVETNNDSNNYYYKMVITTNSEMQSLSSKDIYVRFKLSREQVANLLNDKEVPLDNIVEVNSYSTLKDGKPYASIDRDSIPANANPNSKDKAADFEDDTDTAPTLKLKQNGNRTLSGIVFEDKAVPQNGEADYNPDELHTGKERKGNGQYDAEEESINGVNVVMKETDQNGDIKEGGNKYYIDNKTVNDSKTNFDEYGEQNKNDDKINYKISGFIPGYYKIVYEWGEDNGGKNVNDYKGTIFSEEAHTDGWYKEADPRYSDAKDDWDTRNKIDGVTETNPIPTTMESTTPIFAIGIDMKTGNTDYTDTITTTSNGDELVHDYKNMDFGIIERPRQEIAIKKDVNKVTISDASGRTLIDAEVEEENGVKKFKNDVKFATYLPASEGNPFGTIRAEMDNELFPLSINVEYKIEVANNSEVDYKNENYYWYGNASGLTDNDKIKIKPTGVYDYLDKLLDIDKESFKDDKGNKIAENKVEVISKSDYKTKIEALQSQTTIFDRQYSEYYDENGNYKKEGTWQTFNSPEYKILEEWSYNKETTKITEKKLSGVDKIIELTTLEKELTPGEKNSVTFNALGKLAAKDEISIKNDAEITDVIKTTDYGRRVTAKPSYDRGELITITPPTGESKDYTQIIIISLSAVVLLGVGIIFIKKKVLK